LKTRRLAIAAVAVFASAGLLAGCGAKSGTTAAASASPSPTLAPKDALLAAARPLATSSYQFTIKSDKANGSGAVDALNAVAKLNASAEQDGISAKLEVIRIKTDLWAKVDFGALNAAAGIQPDKYAHIDLSKLQNPDLPFDLKGDPLDVAGLLAGVNDVKTTDGKTYTGTVDLTKMTGVTAPDPDAIQKAGDKAKSVPFTATVDDKGRLNDFKVDGASIDPALALEISFSNFESAANVSAPDDADVIEAPASVLKIFQKS
jgi:hypothetical protein